MNWKEFLKPTNVKIILTAVLIIILMYLSNSYPIDIACSENTECNYKYGFPFISSYNNHIGKDSSGMYAEGLLLNFIIWLAITYLLSSAIIWVLNKKKKSR